MMTVYMQITFCLYGKIKKAMFGKSLQHMVEKADPCADIAFACPVQL